MANELHDFLLVDKYKTPSGETLTDFDRTILDLKRPENHSKKVKTLYYQKHTITFEVFMSASFPLITPNWPAPAHIHAACLYP